MQTYYCSKCGSILQEKVIKEGYDIYTSKELYKRYLQCPKYPGLFGHILGLSIHTIMFIRYEYANNVGLLDDIFEPQQPVEKKSKTKNKSKRTKP